MKPIILILSFFCSHYSIAKDKLVDTVDSKDLVVKTNGETINLEVKDKIITSDEIYSIGADRAHKDNEPTAPLYSVPVKGKEDYFNEVIKISKKYGSKIKIIKGDWGYAWIEAVDPKAQKEVTAMMNWNGKENVKVETVKSSLVNVQTYLHGIAPYYVWVTIMGRAYNRMEFSDSDVALKFAEKLRKQLPLSDTVSLIPGEKGYTWIEPYFSPEEILKATSEKDKQKKKKDLLTIFNSDPVSGKPVQNHDPLPSVVAPVEGK